MKHILLLVLLASLDMGCATVSQQPVLTSPPRQYSGRMCFVEIKNGRPGDIDYIAEGHFHYEGNQIVFTQLSVLPLAPNHCFVVEKSER